MANFEEIKIEGFQTGLMTDPSATDIPLDAALTATNCDLTSYGKLKKSRGLLSFGLPTTPTGMTIEAFYEFHITNPAEKDITIIFGANGGRDRFYITPYWDDLTSAWVTNAWLELTEIVSTTVETRTSNTNYTVASVTGLGASNDYHNKWYAMVFSSADSYRGSDYVLDFVTSTRQVLTKFGVTGTIVGDKVLLMRFPVFKTVSSAITPHYAVDSLPTFTQHGESLYIYTGSHTIDSGPDLWLGFIGTASAVQGYFDDNDLDFRGFHFDHAHPFPPPQSGWIDSSSANVETQNPLPYDTTTDRWMFMLSYLYDDFQESMIWFKEDSFFPSVVSISNDTSSVTLNILWNFRSKTSRYDAWPADEDLISTATNYNTFVSRRVKKILFYAARGVPGTPNSRPVTPFYLWKELDIDDADWASFAISLTLTGIEWDFAQKLPYEINTGHVIEKLGANAKFGGQIGGNFIVGPIYADQEYRDVLIVAPESGVLVGKNITPNVLPLSQWLRFREQGIYDILYWTELNGRLVVFGTNTLAVAEIDGINSRITEQYQKRGLISARAVQVIDGVAYYAGNESIYAFDGNQIQDIGNLIKSDWQAISLANRQASFSGFNRRLKQFYLVAGSTLYVYSTLQNNWKTESLDLIWTYFANGVDGEFLATDGSNIYQLDAASYTTARALTWKSRHFDSSRIKTRRFRASYKSSDTLTVKLYDVELNSTVPIETLYLLAQTTETHVDMPVSFESKRVQIEVTSSSSTNDDTEIDYLALAGSVRPQR